jgi:transporter family-2 protein
MNKGTLLALAISAGACFSLQPPINAALGKSVGVLESAFISFSIGAAVLAAAAWAAGGGGLAALRQIPPWQLSGGFIGAYFVTIALFCAPRLGMTALMVAIVAGQLAGALLLDHFGLLGLQARPLGPAQAVAALLIMAAVWLVQSRG